MTRTYNSNKSLKGQLSIELIIILAILLGVVFLVASKIRESATKAAGSIENTSDKTFGQIESITNYCNSDQDCQKNSENSWCDTTTNTCK
jgi:hypothetical protein